MSPTTRDTRVDAAVLRLLAEPLRAQIVELTGARQTNVSNHLRALREAGLVTSEPFGRFTYYRLEPNAIEGLAAGLSAVATAARTARDRRRPCP